MSDFYFTNHIHTSEASKPDAELIVTWPTDLEIGSDVQTGMLEIVVSEIEKWVDPYEEEKAPLPRLLQQELFQIPEEEKRDYEELSAYDGGESSEEP